MKFIAFAAVLVAAMPADLRADCTAEVDQAFTKLRANPAFRVETVIVDERQGKLTMTVDYQLPDRMHQRVSLGHSPQSMETIVVGGKVWSNQGQGWSAVPANFADAITQQLKESVAEPSKSNLTYQCLGETTFEGKTYVAYKAVLPEVEEKVNGATPPVAKIQTLYLDKVSGLPERNIVTKDNESDMRLFDGTFSIPGDIAINAPS